MAATSLYEELAVEAGASQDRARTEKTAQPGETIDNDRAVDDLYSSLGGSFAGRPVPEGRTEQTATIETIDRDRAGDRVPAALISAPKDLYARLATGLTPRSATIGRTELTESTETIDWDRPPNL
jgi:hypothetical protein